MRRASPFGTRLGAHCTKGQTITIAGHYPAELRPREFHARYTREGRGRPVLALRRGQLRKRYAVLAAAIAMPAMANTPQWQPAAAPLAAHANPASRDESGARYLAAAQAAPGFRPGSAPLDGEILADAGEGLAAGQAARPMRATGSEIDRARAEQCLTMAVYYEAARESDAGQRAVAQVVLNRVAHPSYPNTVCGVVFQGSERSTGCQFTFTCDGSLARRPMAVWWERAARVARDALAGAVYAPVGLATHYHATYVHPYWAPSLSLVATIGTHRFYRWRGAAGQRAAFLAAYLGGEPMAAPHPRARVPVADSEADPLALARSFEAAQAASAGPDQARAGIAAPAPGPSAAPHYSEAIEARGGDALFRADKLPGGGTLSPALERSGQWLDRP